MTNGLLVEVKRDRFLLNKVLNLSIINKETSIREFLLIVYFYILFFVIYMILLACIGPWGWHLQRGFLTPVGELSNRRLPIANGRLALCKSWSAINFFPFSFVFLLTKYGLPKDHISFIHLLIYSFI